MRSRMRRRIVAIVAAAVSALAIVGTTAATASAMVRGHAAAQMNFGRGGVFPVLPSSGLNVASLIGGLAISAAVIGLIAWLALRSDRGSRAQLALATGDSSADESRSVSPGDRERKAA